MPSVQHARLVPAPFARVWPFVRDMDNWAPLVTGYQRHEKLSDVESTWFLKGELGGLTRVAEFKAIVTEWDESGRVTFTLQGINEPVTGSGTFLAEAMNTPAADPLQPNDAIPATGIPRRLGDAIIQFLYDRIFRRPARSVVPAVFAQGPAQTRIIFDLTLNAGGMAGMVMNMLIAPMLKPVAEDLANGIARTFEETGKAGV